MSLNLPPSFNNWVKSSEGLVECCGVASKIVKLVMEDWHRNEIQPHPGDFKCEGKPSCDPLLKDGVPNKPKKGKKYCEKCVRWADDVIPKRLSGSEHYQPSWNVPKSSDFYDHVIEVVKLFGSKGVNVVLTGAIKQFDEFDSAWILFIFDSVKLFYKGDIQSHIKKATENRNTIMHRPVGKELSDNDMEDIFKSYSALLSSFKDNFPAFLSEHDVHYMQVKLEQIRVMKTVTCEMVQRTVESFLKEVEIWKMQHGADLQVIQTSLADVVDVCNSVPGMRVQLVNAETVQGDITERVSKLENEIKHMREPGYIPPVYSVSQDLIQSITEELKKHYRVHVCKKRIYPWGGKWMDFNQVYIPVTIDRDIGSGAKQIKESLESYQELFKIEEDKGHRRFVLVGDPGQGKSSFCAKVAHDWCEGSAPENIRLLFIIDLATVNKDTNVEDAICKNLLSDMQGVHITHIREVIQHLKESIFFIFDGLDDAPGFISSEDCSLIGDGNKVVDVIKYTKMKDCRVLVTTRPWAEEDIKEIPGYKRLELKKLTRDNAKKYIRQFFIQDIETKALGDSLLTFIDENKLTLDTSNPLIVILMCYFWLENGGMEGIPDRLTTLYEKITYIMYKKQPQDFFTKKEIIEGLGKLAAESLSPYETKIVFTEDEIKRVCTNEKAGKQILVQARKMGILCKKGSSLQFFHKSGQEYCAGVYLAKHEDKLFTYLVEIKSVKHALNLGMVLKFATTNTNAAKLVVKKLADIFKSDPNCTKYYEEKAVELQNEYGIVKKEQHPVLDYDEARLLQQIIELIIECNYEGEGEGKFRGSIRGVFVGKIVLTGLTQKLSLSLEYYMKHCGRDVRYLQFQPIAHVQDDISILTGGHMAPVFEAIRKQMLTRELYVLQRVCTRFVQANKDTMNEEMRLIYEFDSDDHDRMAYLAAYISLMEETDDLPSSAEIDIHPIIDSLQHTNLQRFVCRRGHNGYFGLRHNHEYFIRQVINGSIQAQTLAVITVLDASFLTDMGVCSADDVKRLMQSISHMAKLCFLDISHNTIEPISLLHDALSHCPQLQELRMESMKGCTTADIDVIMQVLPNLQLRVLDMADNPLPDINALACLGQCRGLHELDVSAMRGSGPELDALIVAIRELSQLIDLDLQRIKFTEEQLDAFIVTTRELSQLTKLHLYDIRITEKQLHQIVDICRNGKMEELRLDQDCVTAGVREVFKDEFLLWLE